MRVLAQYVRLDGQIHRLAVLEIPADGSRPILLPTDGETHSTIFFNGLILLAPPQCKLPASIRASDALTLLATVPEPTINSPCLLVRIPFHT